MKTETIIPLASGAGLILIGALSLAGNMLLKTEAWRLWPITVLLLGLGLTIPGFWGLRKRGLGSFFIPGLLVLTTGGLLMYCSLTGSWGAWAQAWPLEVIGLALGFGLAAFFMSVPALAIPAIILGANGLLLGFCSLTGLWQAWALLWPVEPLAVGLGLLVLSLYNLSAGLRKAAMILFIIAGGGFFITSLVSVFNNSVLRFAAPALLILTGLLLALPVLIKKAERVQETA